MKKCVLFFMLGAGSTLLMGAGAVMMGNKYYVSTSSDYGVMMGNKYYVSTSSDYGVMMGNKYYVSTSSDYGVMMGNKYYLVWDGEIGENAQKAMAVGFVHGMAVGKKKAEEEARSGY